MSSPRLCKLKCGGRQLYLSTTEAADGELDLLLTDTTKAWTAKVTSEHLRAGNKDADVENYEEQSRCALTGRDADDFEFELKEDKKTDSVKLIWKKVVEPDHIKFQLGSVSLRPVAQLSSAISSIFDRLISSTSDLCRQITELQSEQSRLSAERSEALKELTECANIKDDTEQNLLVKFVFVLNDKKAKIRHLKAELEAAQLQLSSATKGSSAHSQSAPENDVAEASGRDGDQRRKADRERRTSSDRLSCSTDEEERDEKHSSNAKCTVTSSKTAADDKRSRDESKKKDDASTAAATAAVAAADASVDLMLKDSMADDDDDEIPAGPSRAASRKRQMSVPTSSSPPHHSLWQPGVPMMLSTGTTNTSTTSSDHQRWQEKSTKKKESDKSSSSPKHPNSVSKSADIDDLIGDMA